MPSSKLTVPDKGIEKLIREIHGQRVILDRDLAQVYGVTTKAFNQAVKRNLARFPEDFIFRLNKEEAEAIQISRSQTVTLKRGQNLKYLPYAFTEHGALQAANILNSARAVRMSVFVIRAFAKMRDELAANSAMAKRLAQIDNTLFLHDSALRDLYQKLRPLLAPPPDPPPKPRIGFAP
jgi:phage regulator Rha-like protein